MVAAVYFLNNADILFGWSFLSRDFILFFGMLSLFTWLIFLFFPFWQKGMMQSITQLTVGKTIASLFGLLCIFYLSQGLGDRSLGGTVDSLLPPATNGYLKHKDFVSREELESLQWLTSIAQALSIAQTEDKNIFVDFSGKSCTNCRWMEQNIFPRKEVFTKLKNNFILVRLYTDTGENISKNLDLQQSRFGNVALPLYVLLSKDNLLLRQKAGVLKKEKFITFLTI